MKAGYKHRTAALAQYAKLRHLPAKGAAAAMGISEKAVKTYRKKFHEEIGKMAVDTPEVMTWQKIVPMAAGGVRTITVSLAGPPKKEPTQ